MQNHQTKNVVYTSQPKSIQLGCVYTMLGQAHTILLGMCTYSSVQSTAIPAHSLWVHPHPCNLWATFYSLLLDLPFLTCPADGLSQLEGEYRGGI